MCEHSSSKIFSDGVSEDVEGDPSPRVKSIWQTGQLVCFFRCASATITVGRVEVMSFDAGGGPEGCCACCWKVQLRKSSNDMLAGIEPLAPDGEIKMPSPIGRSMMRRKFPRRRGGDPAGLAEGESVEASLFGVALAEGEEEEDSAA